MKRKAPSPPPSLSPSRDRFELQMRFARLFFWECVMRHSHFLLQRSLRWWDDANEGGGGLRNDVKSGEKVDVTKKLVSHSSYMK